MLANYRISISTGLALAFLAGAAFLMADGELSTWAYVLSSVAVLFFALPSFWALKMWLGWANGAKLVAVLGLFVLALVSAAVFTGFPYGHFGYSEQLGYKIFGAVPCLVRHRLRGIELGNQRIPLGAERQEHQRGTVDEAGDIGEELQ